MDSTIIAGILGATSTIVAIILTPIAQQYFESKIFFPISKDRRKCLEGDWQGIVRQAVSVTEFNPINCMLNFKIKGRKVIGTGIITIKPDEMYRVSLNGSFRNDRFLKMDYQNDDSNVLQFGSFIFHLSDDSKELDGRFVGYGFKSKSIIHGTCLFRKP